MPMIQADGCRIHVQVEGPEDAPVLMLSNSLGTNLHMWDDQVKDFTEDFRLVRYDRRGHGRSEVTPGPYTMEQLGRDALAIMDALGLPSVNWCGLSMGGMVGQWLGANAPDRVQRLILSNTSCYYADKTMWHNRIKTIHDTGGLATVAEASLNAWFTRDFLEHEPEACARIKDMVLATPVEGYLGCAAAVRDMDHRALLPRITAPTLVIAGRHDPATTLEAAEYIRSHVPGAALTVLDAAHISNVEQPHDYADTVRGFLLQR